MDKTSEIGLLRKVLFSNLKGCWKNLEDRVQKYLWGLGDKRSPNGECRGSRGEALAGIGGLGNEVPLKLSIFAYAHLNFRRLEINKTSFYCP